MDELVVVAAHGPAYAAACRASLGDAPVLVVDTGSGAVPGADVLIPGGYSTAAYLWAYRHNRTADRFLFVQDSMVALGVDYLEHFRRQWTGAGAVAWATFPMAWDTPGQMEWVAARYEGLPCPPVGIFGPVFYTDRASLDALAAQDLLPELPADKIQAQGCERAWAYAYAAAGLPVTGPPWDYDAMRAGSFPPFRKEWAGRT